MRLTRDASRVHDIRNVLLRGEELLERSLVRPLVDDHDFVVAGREHVMQAAGIATVVSDPGEAFGIVIGPGLQPRRIALRAQHHDDGHRYLPHPVPMITSLGDWPTRLRQSAVLISAGPLSTLRLRRM